MPVLFNNTSIATPQYNSVDLDDIYYNNTLVFSKPKEIILIDKNTPGWSSDSGIRFCSSQGSLDDGYDYSTWKAPKVMSVDCTPYKTLECVCRGRINDTWQPNSVNHSALYMGFRDTDIITDDNKWGSPLPHRTLMSGHQAHGWSDWDNASVSQYYIDGGDFWHEHGYLINEDLTLTLDVSQLTGVHKFRFWATFDNLQICRVDWWVNVKSVRLFR